MQNPVCTCYECRRHGCPCVERDADNQRLQQRVEELEAEIATLRSSADVEREWQPIETAPKDEGSYIIAFPVLMNLPSAVTWCPILDGWRVVLTNQLSPFKPTLWQPLPPPPSPQGESKGEGR
jgi:hypothetical protein